MRPSDDELRSILQAALRAPSADNRHTLRFRMRGDTLQVLSTDDASWPALPHRRLLAMLAYGAALENIALRSSTLGYALQCASLPDRERPGLVAELQWSAADAPPDALASSIDTRHTNRRFYRREPVADEVLDRLRAAAGAVPGTRLVWLDGKAERRLALRAIRIAETERFRRRALHQELFGAVRFDVGWKASVDEGLPPGALEVERGMRSAFALLRHWPVMRASQWIGAHHGLGFRAGYLPCATSPHIGLVLSGPVDVPRPLHDHAALAAGRALQRAWLACESEQLAMQPMAAATVLECQAAGGDWVAEKTQRVLRQLLQSLASAHGGFRPQLLFRLGRAGKSTQRTCRTTPHLDAT